MTCAWIPATAGCLPAPADDAIATPARGTPTAAGQPTRLPDPIDGAGARLGSQQLAYPVGLLLDHHAATETVDVNRTCGEKTGAIVDRNRLENRLWIKNARM